MTESQLASPGMIAFSLYVFLAIFMAAGAAINYFTKRPSVNGASLFLVVAGLLILMKVIFAARESASAEKIGEIIGVHLIPILIASFFAYRFSKRKSLAKVSSDENS